MSKKIKLLVEVDKPVYHSVLERVKKLEVPCCTENAYYMQAIANGTPITEGDLISRSELLDSIQKFIVDNDKWYEDWDKGYNCGLHTACELIKSALSVGGSQNE